MASGSTGGGGGRRAGGGTAASRRNIGSIASRLRGNRDTSGDFF